MLRGAPDTQFDADLGGERLRKRQHGPRETCIHKLRGDVELLGLTVMQESAVFACWGEEVNARGSAFWHENEVPCV